MPEARCYQSTSYRGGAITLWVDGLTTKHVDIWRTDKHGNSPMLIRAGYNIEVKSNRVIVTDPEVPFSDVVVYNVYEHAEDRNSPTKLIVKTSGCLVSGESRYPDDTAICSPIYVCDPLYPSYGDWYGLLGIDSLSYPGRTQLFDVLARRAPVAVSQVRSTARTSMRLMTRTLEERQMLLDTLSSGRILLLRNPDPRYPEDNWYFSVGEVSEERIASDHRDPHRRWVIDVIVVDRPVGKLAVGVQANRTYETLRDYEPDGIRAITPAQYGSPRLAGAYTDYSDYVHVLIGGGSAAPKDARTRGSAPRAYGNSTFPTVQAVATSWGIP